LIQSAKIVSHLTLKELFMLYQQLGKSTLKISKIGFGCMSIKPDQLNIQSIIDAAIEGGINYFDTADIYNNGLNEINIGKALKEKRKQIIIATKVGNQLKEDGAGLNWNPSKKHIINAVEKSLSNLQTDYIDLYQLHGGTIEDNIDETIEAFEILKEQGKIRYYGLSSIRPNVIKEYVKRSNIISVMMQYSLLDRRPEETCLPLLLANNIGVLARGSIAGGLLVGKAVKPYLNYSQAQIEIVANAIKETTSIKSNTVATAVKFALHHKAITAAIVGIRTQEQLAESIQIFKDVPLTQHECELLQNSIPTNFYEQHL